MKTLRTIHGEGLTERIPGEGRSLRRRFTTRQVWCPTCQAEPGHRCAWTLDQADPWVALYPAPSAITWAFLPAQAADQERRRVHWLAEQNRRGWDHAARRARAEQLTTLGARPAQLLRLAVTDAPAAPAQRSSPAGLPLFSNPADQEHTP